MLPAPTVALCAGEAEPLDYDAFPVPLPPGAVRLGVVFFQASISGAAHSGAAGPLASVPLSLGAALWVGVVLVCRPGRRRLQLSRRQRETVLRRMQMWRRCASRRPRQLSAARQVSQDAYLLPSESMQESNPELAAAVFEAAQEVLAALPPGGFSRVLLDSCRRAWRGVRGAWAAAPIVLAPALPPGRRCGRG